MRNMYTHISNATFFSDILDPEFMFCMIISFKRVNCSLALHKKSGSTMLCFTTKYMVKYCITSITSTVF